MSDAVRMGAASAASRPTKAAPEPVRSGDGRAWETGNDPVVRRRAWQRRVQMSGDINGGIA